jgi:hypothetical protein
MKLLIPEMRAGIIPTVTVQSTWLIFNGFNILKNSAFQSPNFNQSFLNKIQILKVFLLCFFPRIMSINLVKISQQ